MCHIHPNMICKLFFYHHNIGSMCLRETGINSVSDRLVNKDPGSLLLIGIIGLLLILSVIGWMGCFIAICKVRKGKEEGRGRGVYRVWNFPSFNEDDKKSNSLSTIKSTAEPNGYTTIPLPITRTNTAPKTTPTSLPPPPTDVILRQGSVETYKVNIKRKEEKEKE